MKIKFINCLKWAEGWYQSFHILPTISIYKDCDTNEYVLYIIWLHIGIKILKNK